MTPPLIILALEVATLVCAACVVACGVILGHQKYGAWTPPAFRIDVGLAGRGAGRR